MVSSQETFPFMVVGNKVDLEDDARAVSTESAQEWCRHNGNLEFIETSAAKNQNVEEAFVRLAKQALIRQ